MALMTVMSSASKVKAMPIGKAKPPLKNPQ